MVLLPQHRSLLLKPVPLTVEEPVMKAVPRVKQAECWAQSVATAHRSDLENFLCGGLKRTLFRACSEV